MPDSTYLRYRLYLIKNLKMTPRAEAEPSSESIACHGEPIDGLAPGQPCASAGP